jgi:hypothetical protein
MRITKSVLVFLAALIFTLPGLAQAADLAVFPVETTNLTPQDGAAVGELLAQSYAAVSGKAVLAPSRTQQTLAMAANHQEAAQSLGVSEYVRISAVGVGRRIVIQATLHDQRGARLYQSKMTADSVEDMTNVSDRLARALVERVDTDSVRTPRNVTIAEGRAKNRLWTDKVFGVKSGVHMPDAKNADYSPNVSLQFNGRLELDSFFLEVGAGIIVPTSYKSDCWDSFDDNCEDEAYGRVGGLTAEVGGSVFLNEGNVGVYAGGGFIPRLTLRNDTATASVYGQLGVTFPREASTRLYADLRVAQAVIETHLDNGAQRYPTEFALHVGVGW